MQCTATKTSVHQRARNPTTSRTTHTQCTSVHVILPPLH